MYITLCFFNLCKIFESLDPLNGLQIIISLKTVPENIIIFFSSFPTDVAEYLIIHNNRTIKQKCNILNLNLF